MSDEDTPKSAVEIAMEKLKARGDYTERRLSNEQKAEIADLRSRYKAKIAELEIHQESKLQMATTPEEVETLRTELTVERDRLNEAAESKVEEIRSRD